MPSDLNKIIISLDVTKFINIVQIKLETACGKSFINSGYNLKPSLILKNCNGEEYCYLFHAI